MAPAGVTATFHEHAPCRSAQAFIAAGDDPLCFLWTKKFGKASGLAAAHAYAQNVRTVIFMARNPLLPLLFLHPVELRRSNGVAQRGNVDGQTNKVENFSAGLLRLMQHTLLATYQMTTQ